MSAFDAHDYQPDPTGRCRFASSGYCDGTRSDTAHELGRLIGPHDHAPNDAGTACRHCGLPAEPVDPDETAEALADELADAAERRRQRWEQARAGADFDRTTWRAARARIPFDSVTEARATIVPDPDDPDSPHRQREAGEIAASAARHFRHRHLDPTYSEEIEIMAGRRMPYNESSDSFDELAALGGRAFDDANRWPIVRAARESASQQTPTD